MTVCLHRPGTTPWPYRDMPPAVCLPPWFYDQKLSEPVSHSSALPASRSGLKRGKNSRDKLSCCHGVWRRHPADRQKLPPSAYVIGRPCRRPFNTIIKLRPRTATHCTSSPESPKTSRRRWRRGSPARPAWPPAALVA